MSPSAANPKRNNLFIWPFIYLDVNGAGFHDTLTFLSGGALSVSDRPQLSIRGRKTLWLILVALVGAKRLCRSPCGPVERPIGSWTDLHRALSRARPEAVP